MVNEGLQEVLHTAARGENVTCILLEQRRVRRDRRPHDRDDRARPAHQEHARRPRRGLARLPDPDRRPDRRAPRRGLRRARLGAQRRQRRPDQEDVPARVRDAGRRARLLVRRGPHHVPDRLVHRDPRRARLPHVDAGARPRARRAQGRPRVSVVVAYPWNVDDPMLGPVRDRFPDLEHRRPAVPRAFRSSPPGPHRRAHRRRACGVGARRGDARARPPDGHRRTRARPALGAGDRRRDRPSRQRGAPGGVRGHQRRRCRGRADRGVRVRAGCSRCGSGSTRSTSSSARTTGSHASVTLVEGLTLGIIGLGAIGTTVAVRARAFGMTTIGTRRSYQARSGAPGGRRARAAPPICTTCSPAATRSSSAHRGPRRPRTSSTRPRSRR